MTLAGPGPKAKINMLRPAAWYQFNRGLTYVSGKVSVWADQTANARHLLQATGSARPVQQTDGSILCDGSATFLQTATFTLAQPTMVYMLFRQVTFTNASVLCDGFTVTSGQFLQDTTTPNISLSSGTTAVTNTSFTLNTYAVGAALFSAAVSTLTRNKGASPTSATVGTTAMAGFTLGADGGGANFGNIQAKEIIIFPVAHTPTQQLQVINYLSMIGGLGL
jgi:hypothetical protein